MIRVLVVDDQTVVREGLFLMLSQMRDIEVVGLAADGQDALDQLAAAGPDVVLLDLRMPRMDGVEATRQILKARPSTKIVILTTYSDDRSIFSALDAGADGYLTKHSPASEIERTIHAVHGGDVQFDPLVQARLARTTRRGRLDVLRPAGLTARELEVLKLMAAGLSNDELATHLHVSEATVKTHVNNIFSKLEVRDRARAIAYAYRQGLADEP